MSGSDLFLTGVGWRHVVVSRHQVHNLDSLGGVGSEFLVSVLLSLLQTDLPNPPNLLQELADVLRIVLETVDDQLQDEEVSRVGGCQLLEHLGVTVHLPLQHVSTDKCQGLEDHYYRSPGPTWKMASVESWSSCKRPRVR